MIKKRKPNLKDKIDLVRECIFEIIGAFFDFDIDRIILMWILMWDGINGKCEVLDREEML